MRQKQTFCATKIYGKESKLDKTSNLFYNKRRKPCKASFCSITTRYKVRRYDEPRRKNPRTSHFYLKRRRTNETDENNTDLSHAAYGFFFCRMLERHQRKRSKRTYTGFSSSYYNSAVQGSLYTLNMKVDAGGKELKIEITIVRNDRGYGIYQLEIDG